MTLNNRLRELRMERGYTQAEMQLLTNIDQSDYSKIERGERYMSFEQCKRLAFALDTSMDYLAGLTDEKKPYPQPESIYLADPTDETDPDPQPENIPDD